ncbi:MAG: hypothetical protein ACYC99_13685 [Candidatus Geothermincolia bacterium]
MRGKGNKVGPDELRRPNGVDKRKPPAFLAQREHARFPRRWWAGLTSGGRCTILVVAILLIALIVGLSVSLAGSSTTGKDVKPRPRPKPRPEVVVKPRPRPLYSYSSNSARLDIAVLASGLTLTLEAMSVTSAKLEAELAATYGAGPDTFSLSGGLETPGPAQPPTRLPEMALTASLDVLADGPDGAQPATPVAPGTDIGKRYVTRYREYLALLTSIRAGAETIPAAGKQALERSALIKACDELMRDTSVIVSGLEQLGADPGEDGIIAAGIGAANDRILETSKRVDSLIDAIRKK